MSHGAFNFGGLGLLWERLYKKNLSHIPRAIEFTTATIWTKWNVRSNDILPRDCLYNVFSFLDASDLILIQQVNKNWCDLANDEMLWKEVFTNRFGAIETLNIESNSRFLMQPISWKRQYFIRAYEEKWGFLRKWREDRNAAVKRGLTTGFLGKGFILSLNDNANCHEGGPILSTPIFLILYHTQHIHHMSPKFLGTTFAYFCVSLFIQDFFESMLTSTAKSTKVKIGAEAAKLNTGLFTIGMFGYISWEAAHAIGRWSLGEESFSLLPSMSSLPASIWQLCVNALSFVI